MRTAVVLSMVAGLIAVAAPTFAQLNVTINTPAGGTRVNPGDSVSVSVTVSGAVAGISQITVSGERDPLGDTVFSFNPSPPTNSATRTTTYEIPLDALQDEELTLSVNAQGFADSPGNASITLLGPAAPVEPANDDLVSAQQIIGLNGSTTGDNSNGSKEGSEANHAGNAGGNSIWYRWTAPAHGDVTFDTTGSAIDTLLAVYTGSAFPLTLVDQNDNTTGTASEVSFFATPGTTYRIAVDGKSGAEGAIDLAWSLPAPAAADGVWTMYE